MIENEDQRMKRNLVQSYQCCNFDIEWDDRRKGLTVKTVRALQDKRSENMSVVDERSNGGDERGGD